MISHALLCFYNKVVNWRRNAYVWENIIGKASLNLLACSSIAKSHELYVLYILCIGGVVLWCSCLRWCYVFLVKMNCLLHNMNTCRDDRIQSPTIGFSFRIKLCFRINFYTNLYLHNSEFNFSFILISEFNLHSKSIVDLL